MKTKILDAQVASLNAVNPFKGKVDYLLSNYIANKSENNWNMLMCSMSPIVLKCISQFTTDKEKINTLEYSVFAAVFCHCEEYKPEVSTFSTYLWAVTKNTCLEWLKRKKKDAEFYYDITPQLNKPIYDETYDCESREQAEKELCHTALKTINNQPNPNKAIMQMKILHNLTFKEIAKELGEGESFVKNHYYQTKKYIMQVIIQTCKDAYLTYCFPDDNI